MQAPGEDWSQNQTVRIFSPGKATAPYVEAQLLRQVAVGDQWAGDLRRSKAMLQIHEVTLNPSGSFSQPILMYFVLGEVADTVVLQEVTSEDVVSMVDAMSQKFTVVTPSEEWNAQKMADADHCGLAFDEERIRLCSYVAPFRVLGGTVINAWVIGDDHLTWESEMTTLRVPLEFEPDSEDENFNVNLTFDASLVKVRSDLFVLPEATPRTKFTLGMLPNLTSRDFCVLATPYSHTRQFIAHQKTMLDCVWQQQEEDFLDTWLLSGTLAQPDASLNVTILWTAKVQDYLWSFPRKLTILWLTERSPPASIATVSPANHMNPSALVWLTARPDMESLLQATVDVVGTARCFFTVSAFEIPVDYNETSLRTVRALPSEVDSVLSVMQDGEVLDSAVRFKNGWTTSKSRVSSQKESVGCHWTTGFQHSSSLLLLLIRGSVRGPCGSDTLHRCQFVCTLRRRPLKQPVSASLMEPKVSSGSDATSSCGAVMLASPTHLSHDLTIEAAAGYPLQVKYSGVGATPAVLAEAAQGGGVAELFSGHFAYESQWNTVSHWDPPFTVRSLSQSDASSSEHTLIQVSTRLLVDINTWSQQSPMSFLALTGRMPSVTVGDVDALTLSVQTSSNGRILFRWSKISVGELRAVDGGQIWRVVSGAANVLRAYSMEVGVRTRLLVKETRPGICSANLSEEGVPLVQEDRTIGPRLCQGGSSLQLRKPPGQGWLLWAVAFAPGLALSDPRGGQSDGQLLQ